MAEVSPLIVHVTVCVLPDAQFSPPLGALTVSAGGVAAVLIVKVASLASCARMLPLTSSARTRTRAWLVLMPVGSVQLNERALGVSVTPTLV